MFSKNVTNNNCVGDVIIDKMLFPSDARKIQQRSYRSNIVDKHSINTSYLVIRSDSSAYTYLVHIFNGEFLQIYSNNIVVERKYIRLLVDLYREKQIPWDQTQPEYKNKV